jgi:UDP-N-acetyl-D-glucosamine/UDP-N-acetyl-D-galactosamine dehydrogenase
VGQGVNALYADIITAGTHLASSIKVAEAAKVIENTQRDLNIALMNELSLIFNRLGIDTLEVLQAAGTKWNFLPFRPGLVGGHCIGVDPFYLTHKAQEVGYHPEVILAGRRINDGMARYVADETVKLMLRKNIPVLQSKVLVLGLTIKENCPDLRNTKLADIVKHLQTCNLRVDIFDPWIVVNGVLELPAKFLHCLPMKTDDRSDAEDSTDKAIVSLVIFDASGVASMIRAVHGRTPTRQARGWCGLRTCYGAPISIDRRSCQLSNRND